MRSVTFIRVVASSFLFLCINVFPSEALKNSIEKCVFIKASFDVTNYPSFVVDTHSTYWITAFKYKHEFEHILIRGEFPYATLFSVISYGDDGFVVDQLRDSEIDPNFGSVNPYREGSLVLDPNRSFTIRAYPKDDSSPKHNLTNVLNLPSRKSNDVAYIILRVYQDISGAPKSTKPSAHRISSDGEELACLFKKHQLDFPEIESSFSPPQRLFPGPSLDVDFFPMTDSELAFQNGEAGNYITATINMVKSRNANYQCSPARNRMLRQSTSNFRNPKSKHDDTSNTWRKVDTAITVIEIRKLPKTFNSKNVNSKTLFSDPRDARYTSLCLYGGERVRGNCISVDEMIVTDGSAYIVLADKSFKRRIKRAKLNYLEVTEISSRISTLELPFLIYRSFSPSPDYAGSLLNVPLFPGDRCEMTEDYKVDLYIGDYAPHGRQCSPTNFIHNGCGFPAVAAAFKRDVDIRFL